VDGDLEHFGAGFQPRKKLRVVRTVLEHRLAVAAALDDVMGQVRDDQTGQAGHGKSTDEGEWLDFTQLKGRGATLTLIFFANEKKGTTPSLLLLSAVFRTD
jgi:hypothetical protein